ncbi:signal transduction histidine kinase [Branchiibius hedensis]|uniref:histidine kinase n=1 Tax=Branchiibius hedensis TaxID=672460 RepID=A0A2Y9A0E2_9MICO|nr:histidine kinase [Branchiibius hedensis]PWJ27158.1 signal transduction histidine kinase [Branchiibius hedensis]SSA35969.1 Signal transduction histidine kinase [Branchiibius hedensis]
MSSLPARTPWGIAWRFVLALLVGALSWVAFFPQEQASDLVNLWLMVGDPLIGVLSLIGALRWVRRYPVAVGLITSAVACVAPVAGGAASYALGSVSTRRRWSEIAVVGVANVLSGIVAGRLYNRIEDASPWWSDLLIGVLVTAVVIAVGVAVGQRRELVANLREQVASAQREQAVREDAARAGERTRIAREMHDVLAHRISLVAMHAGALAYRPDLTETERSTAARTIEENAHQALQELRDVLGVLRDPASGLDAPEGPQPLIGDIPSLVAESQAAGVRIELEQRVTGEPPATISRTAYRVVQEGLTNARKHAPDTAVQVLVDGAPEDGVSIVVANPLPLSRNGSQLPGAGMGLLGVSERVSRVGGTVSHGPERGDFRLAVWLPWST